MLRSTRLALSLAFVLSLVLAPPLAAQPFTRHRLDARPAAPADSMATTWSFGLRYQDDIEDRLWHGRSEANLEQVIADTGVDRPIELYTRTRSWTAEGRAALGDRVVVIATLPYHKREHRQWIRHTPTYDPQYLDTWTFQGIGDATVIAHVTALRRDDVFSVALQGGAKLPTGRAHVPGETRDNFGVASTLDPSLRLGSGSTDWLAGALASVTTPWRRALPLTATVLRRWNGEGTDDYRVGDALQAGLAGGWSATPRVDLLAQVTYAEHDGDSPGPLHLNQAHGAMRSLFVAPGVSVRVRPKVSAYGLYQARVWGESDDPRVVARDTFLFGTRYALGR